MNTKKILATSVAFGALTVAGLTTAAFARGGRSVETDSMIGVPATLVGTAGQIRGINGAGLAWSIGRSSAEVSASGKVEVSFTDLVFAGGPNVGKNTVASMKVIVSCLDTAGAAVNLSTPAFPVTTATPTDPGGDGRIESIVALPSPCLAPIVFIASLGGAWFAVDGL
jgi:hypothetical protein